MTELKFDHTKKETLEAIGLTDNDLECLNHKLANLSKFIILEQPKQSQVSQRIAETFNYNELIVIATMFVTDKTLEMVKNNPLVALLGLLKDKGE
jgi:hypothetical protein